MNKRENDLCLDIEDVLTRQIDMENSSDICTENQEVLPR